MPHKNPFFPLLLRKDQMIYPSIPPVTAFWGKKELLLPFGRPDGQGPSCGPNGLQPASLSHFAHLMSKLSPCFPWASLKRIQDHSFGN